MNITSSEWQPEWAARNLGTVFLVQRIDEDVDAFEDCPIVAACHDWAAVKRWLITHADEHEHTGMPRLAVDPYIVNAVTVAYGKDDPRLRVVAMPVLT